MNCPHSRSKETVEKSKNLVAITRDTRYKIPHGPRSLITADVSLRPREVWFPGCFSRNAGNAWLRHSLNFRH